MGRKGHSPKQTARKLREAEAPGPGALPWKRVDRSGPASKLLPLAKRLRADGGGQLRRPMALEVGIAGSRRRPCALRLGARIQRALHSGRAGPCCVACAASAGNTPSQTAATGISLHFAAMLGHLDPRGRRPVQTSRAVQTRDHPMQHDMVRLGDSPGCVSLVSLVSRSPAALTLPSLSPTPGRGLRIPVAAMWLVAVPAVLSELISRRLNLLCHPR
jgi:hypothetical protein